MEGGVSEEAQRILDAVGDRIDGQIKKLISKITLIDTVKSPDLKHHLKSFSGIE